MKEWYKTIPKEIWGMQEEKQQEDMDKYIQLGRPILGRTGAGENGVVEPNKAAHMMHTPSGPVMVHEGEATMQQPDGNIRVIPQKQLQQIEKNPEMLSAKHGGDMRGYKCGGKMKGYKDGGTIPGYQDGGTLSATTTTKTYNNFKPMSFNLAPPRTESVTAIDSTKQTDVATPPVPDATDIATPPPPDTVSTSTNKQGDTRTIHQVSDVQPRQTAIIEPKTDYLKPINFNLPPSLPPEREEQTVTATTKESGDLSTTFRLPGQEEQVVQARPDIKTAEERVAAQKTIEDVTPIPDGRQGDQTQEEQARQIGMDMLIQFAQGNTEAVDAMINRAINATSGAGSAMTAALKQEAAQAGLSPQQTAEMLSRRARDVEGENAELAGQLSQAARDMQISASQALVTQALAGKEFEQRQNAYEREIADSDWQRALMYYDPSTKEGLSTLQQMYVDKFGGPPPDMNVLTEERNYAQRKREQDLVMGDINIETGTETLFQLKDQYADNKNWTQYDAAMAIKDYDAAAKVFEQITGYKPSMEQMRNDLAYQRTMEQINENQGYAQLQAMELGLESQEYENIIRMINTGASRDMINAKEGTNLSVSQYNDLKRRYDLGILGDELNIKDARYNYEQMVESEEGLELSNILMRNANVPGYSWRNDPQALAQMQKYWEATGQTGPFEMDWAVQQNQAATVSSYDASINQIKTSDWYKEKEEKGESGDIDMLLDFMVTENISGGLHVVRYKDESGEDQMFIADRDGNVISGEDTRTAGEKQEWQQAGNFADYVMKTAGYTTTPERVKQYLDQGGERSIEAFKNWDISNVDPMRIQNVLLGNLTGDMLEGPDKTYLTEYYNATTSEREKMAEENGHMPLNFVKSTFDNVFQLTDKIEKDGSANAVAVYPDSSEIDRMQTYIEGQQGSFVERDGQIYKITGNTTDIGDSDSLTSNEASGGYKQFGFYVENVDTQEEEFIPLYRINTRKWEGDKWYNWENGKWVYGGHT